MSGQLCRLLLCQTLKDPNISLSDSQENQRKWITGTRTQESGLKKGIQEKFTDIICPPSGY
jgi:hypothetical protein